MLFLDLHKQRKRIDEDLQARISRVMDHGRFVMGPEVGELEKALADYVGVPHALSCSSGTDALLMPLMAFGIGPGDAVITTPFTFVATAEVIALLGARPVFVDVDRSSFNIDPAGLPDAVAFARGQGLRPRGIIGVDLFGLPADYEPICSFARDHDLFVIEDLAQALGATRSGARAGSFGDVGATSFFPAKPLGCYGDGGAVFTNDEELAGRMRSIRVHGEGENKYDNVRIGINGRMDTLQAAVLLAKLPIFEEEIQRRNEIAARYSDALRSAVAVPGVPDGVRSAWAQYTVMCDERDRLKAFLGEREIPTAIYYHTPLHLQPAFASLGYHDGDFPVSEELSRKALSLPVHPYLEEQEIDSVIGAVLEAV